MRTRPMLHEAEAQAKTYEAEATKFGLEAVTSLIFTHPLVNHVAFTTRQSRMYSVTVKPPPRPPNLAHC